MKTVFTALVVDDNPVARSICAEIVEDWGGNVLQAGTIAEAERLLQENPGRIHLTLLDGCVPGHKLNTLHLIEMCRKAGCDKIIAISSDSSYNRVMVEAGCTGSVNKEKLPDKLPEILDQMSEPSS
jgi:CheY-like chemotaxis protein